MVPLERQLKWVELRGRLGFEQAIEALAVHQVGADQAGEGEQAGDGLLRRLGQAQQQKGNQRDGDLDTRTAFSEVPRKR